MGEEARALTVCGKSDLAPRDVIPAKAESRILKDILDSRFRWSDGYLTFSAN